MRVIAFNRILRAVLMICAALAFIALTFFDAASAQAGATRRLREAAASGNLALAREALQGGAAINAGNESGETPLLIAVQNNRLEVFKLLLERGANINAQARNMDSPWLLAGARGRTAMLELMAPLNPDLSLRNRFGGSALVPACHYGHVETVRFLLAKTKIAVDQVNNLGWTCLLEAIILGDGGKAHQDIVRMALAAGANPSLADKDGVTPLQHARRMRQGAIVRLLEQAGGK